MEEIAYIEDVIFVGKQNIPWNQVEAYLKQYIGRQYTVKETGDVITSQVIGKMIVIAKNKRWMENKNEKHNKDAVKGWYRYDTYFAMPVQGSSEEDKRINIYRATLVVRNSLKGLYLYDIINIKKEASKPL